MESKEITSFQVGVKFSKQQNSIAATDLNHFNLTAF